MSTATPFRLIFAAQGELLDAARALEAQPDLLVYDTSSIFLAVTDAAGRLLGAARLILPGPAGLKSLGNPHTERAARLFGVDAGWSWDLASFTVRPGTGEGRAAAALCHAIVQALRTNRVHALVATLDARARLTFAAAGLLPDRLPGAPAEIRCARVSELLDEQRRTNPDGYRLVSQGAGLEGVRLPSSDELLVPAAVRAGLSWTKAHELAKSA
jgi:hypothetical protein